MDQINFYVDQLDKELDKFDFLKKIDSFAGFPKAKAYVVIALGILYVLLLLFNVAGSLLTNMLGFLYPAYQSFKAIETKGPEDDTQWLTYWTVYGFFTVIEVFTDIILHWLPFYYIMKATFLVYLLLPQFRGAAFIYKRILRPFLVQHEFIIDGAFEKAKRKISGTIKND